jgi:cytochrome P450
VKSTPSDSALALKNHGSEANKTPYTEEILTPIRGSYIPWADGLRVCPGKKFAEVEFVAVIAALLRRHRVEVVSSAGETVSQARKRVYRVVEDSRLRLTLQMRNPDSVWMRWVEREVAQ